MIDAVGPVGVIVRAIIWFGNFRPPGRPISMATSSGVVGDFKIAVVKVAIIKRRGGLSGSGRDGGLGGDGGGAGHCRRRRSR